LLFLRDESRLIARTGLDLFCLPISTEKQEKCSEACESFVWGDIELALKGSLKIRIIFAIYAAVKQKSEGISPRNLLFKSPSLHHNPPHVKFGARKQIIR
jgi:hypothetical protein